MKNSRLVATATMAVLMGSVFQPVAAQAPRGNDSSDQRNDRDNNRNNNNRNNYNRNDNTYQNGYRAGFDDGRANRRFDDIRGNGRGDRSQLWQQRYSRVYTYNDDNYYQQCRNSPDPAGVIAGALIGGLLGNAVGNNNNRTGTTVAGVIVGGAVGASLTQNLDCEDRSYSYKAYYDGFNGGRANQEYAWRNPRSGRRGTIRVGDYYNDPDGFRCTTFSQSIYVSGREQEGRGRACQQPDGSWAIVS